MRTPILALTALLLALLVLVPAASAQDLPDAIDDPVEAVTPQDPAADPAPAAEAPAGPSETGPIAGIADATFDEDDATGQGARASGGPAVAATPSVGGTGELPFTGSDSRQVLLLMLVGLTTILGGFVASLWASASETRH